MASWDDARIRCVRREAADSGISICQIANFDGSGGTPMRTPLAMSNRVKRVAKPDDVRGCLSLAAEAGTMGRN